MKNNIWMVNENKNESRNSVIELKSLTIELHGNLIRLYAYLKTTIYIARDQREEWGRLNFTNTSKTKHKRLLENSFLELERNVFAVRALIVNKYQKQSPDIILYCKRII